MTDETDNGGAAEAAEPRPKATLAENMRKALAMKRAAGAEKHPDGGRGAGEGFQPTTGRGAPATGPARGQDDTDTASRSRGGQIRKRDGGGG